MNTQQRKYLAIAAVVGLHAVVITFMLAQHGCKSGAQKTTAPTALNATKATETSGSMLPGDDERGFYPPTVPPPEIVRIPTPPPVQTITPIQVAQYTETLGPTIPLGGPSMSAPPTSSLPPMAVMYEVGPGENLSTIARKNGITLKELVDANAPKITNSTILQPKMQLKIPSHAAPATAPVVATGDERLYKVVANDSLAKIAQNNHTTIKALQAANSMGTSTAIREGQSLKIPAAAAAVGTGTSAPAPGGPVAGDGTYKVLQGETLGSIARKIGVPLKDLYASSGYNDATAKNVRAGQIIKLPPNAHTPDAATPAPGSSTDTTPTMILTPIPSGPQHLVPMPVPSSSSSTGTSPPVTAIRNP